MSNKDKKVKTKVKSSGIDPHDYPDRGDYETAKKAQKEKKEDE